jgi:hypothetical protein
MIIRDLRLTYEGLRKHTKKCTPEEGPHNFLGIEAEKDQHVAYQSEDSEDQHSLSLIQFLSEFLEDEGDEDARGFHHNEEEGVKEERVCFIKDLSQISSQSSLRERFPFGERSARKNRN